MVGAGTLLLGGQRPGSPACLNLACNAPHHAEPRVTTGTPNWLFKLQLVAGTGSNGRDREPVAGEAILASFFSSEKRIARRKFHYCLVALYMAACFIVLTRAWLVGCQFFCQTKIKASQ